MVEKNYWKDRLACMNVAVKEVRRAEDKSAIEGWYTFVYNGIPVFTYRDGGKRWFEVGYPPYPPYADHYEYDVEGQFCCSDLNGFIENINDYVRGTDGNKLLREKLMRDLFK